MTRSVLACVRLAETLILSAVVVATLALPSAACADVRPPSTGPQPPRGGGGGGEERSAREKSGPFQTGFATYYADSLRGNKTANGERYDPEAYTAAHRTLPFGTIVEVERKDGRKVRVRINDRGPFGDKTRVIDLSRRAAEDLGVIKDGVIKVSLRVISR